MNAVTPIAEVQDGSVATIAGRVVPAGAEILTAPLSGEDCVYWETYGSLRDSRPDDSKGVPFWIEDGSGKALILSDEMTLSARVERHEEWLSIIDADISDVSTRLSELKRERKEAYGSRATALHKEIKAKKKLATYLCAVGAHANGKVHVGGTLEGQEKYIRGRRSEFEAPDRESSRALSLVNERFEVALKPGDHILVTGYCATDFVPPSLGGAVGYRDLASCLHVKSPHDGALEVRGVGATAIQSDAQRAREGQPTAIARVDSTALVGHSRTEKILWVAILGGVAYGLHWCL